MRNLKKRWRQTPKAIRQSLVFILGSSIVLTGVAMLLLPGPGWAAIFLGFAVLATEFAFAVKVRDWLVKELKVIIHSSKKAWQAFWQKIRRR